MKMRLCVLLVVLCGTISNVFGYDFKYGDLYYNITSNNAVEVTISTENFWNEGNYPGLTSVVIPEKVVYNGTTYSVTGIGKHAFYGCNSLISITIPNSVTSIGEMAFSSCNSLVSVTIPNSVTSIGDFAFASSSLISITMGDGITSTGNHTFQDCSRLTIVTIGNSVTNIGIQAFYNCSRLTSVTIGKSVTSISLAAFYGCNSLVSVTLPNSMTTIGELAFAGCTNLTSITIPSSVTNIDDGAFAGCRGLQEITFHSSTPPANLREVFTNYDSIKAVYVPCGSAKEYSAAGWASSLFKEFQYAISVTTTDATMGTARVDRQTTCSDNMAIISATPNPGYYFYQWSDHYLNNPHTLFLTSDTVFTAIFIPYTYTITAVGTDHGKVSGAGTYDCGTIVTLTAIPNTGYHFTQWNDGNTDNPRTIVVADKDSTFAAEFAIDTYQITIVYDMKKGLVSGGGSYEYGTRVRLEAEPNSGYLFSQWSDGKTYNPYIFTALEDLTLEAVFIPATGIENTPAEDAESVQKVLRDGQIYILREGKIYDIVGKEIH